MSGKQETAPVIQIDRRRLAEKDKPRDRKAEAERRAARDKAQREQAEREALAALEARGVIPTPAAPAATPAPAAPPEPRAVREPRPPAEPIPPGSLGVVDQVRLALRPRSRLAFGIGLLLGAFVPLATFVISHTELDLQRPLWGQLPALFVAGGLLFSAVTMYGWGKLAFLQRAKALGFVLLLEGTMVTSHTRWLALGALCYLCAINGVATACNLAGSQWQK